MACAAVTSYPKTRLTRIQTAEATRYLNCFDALGRPGRSQQKLATGEVDNFTYGDSVTYGYAANGAVRLVTYPAPAATAGRTVTTTYDDAGRVSTVQGVKSGQSTSYVGSVAYAPHGGAKQVQWPSQESSPATVSEATTYTTLLQPDSIAVTKGSGASTVAVWSVHNSYVATGVCNGTTSVTAQCNNGNVQSQQVTASLAREPQRTQTYSYDGLNRLRRMSEAAVTGGTAWGQGYVYDAYGNMALDTSVSGAWIPSGTRTPQATETTVATLFTGNRLSTLLAGYDGAGNVTQDVQGQVQYEYDGENRVVWTSVGATYRYDGEGHRVGKTVGSTRTVYVYDAGGELAAEYGAALSGVGTQRYVGDGLGSTRAVVERGGDGGADVRLSAVRGGRDGRG